MNDSSDQKEGSSEVIYPRIFSTHRRKRSLQDETEGQITDKILIFRSFGKVFYIHLTPNVDIRSENFTVLVRGHHSQPLHPTSEDCHFHGNILSHPQGYAAVSVCGPDKQISGVIVTENDIYVLQPLDRLDHDVRKRASPTYSGYNDDVIPHVMQRLFKETKHFCGVEYLGDTPSIKSESQDVIRERVRRADSSGRKVIETAVYVDESLYKKYSAKKTPDPVVKLQDAVLAIVNQVQLIYNYRSLRTKFKIVVVKMEILTEGKDSPDTADGDIDLYLDNFCEWQSKQNPPASSKEHWDHALMLTGLNLFKSTRGNRRNEKVLGLAWVNGMCRPQHSCTLNEGSSFEAAFVIAHEMGHSLGMLHDGRGNNCDPNKYLMSEKTGPGKITWSACSNNYLNKFFQKGYGSCLEDDNSPPSAAINHESDGRLPGQRFPLSEQCKLSLGENFKPHVTTKEPFNNVCRELWCVSGLWASVAHPALEGSTCGSGKQCVQGSCVRVSASARASANTAIVNEMRHAVADFLERLRAAFRQFGS